MAKEAKNPAHLTEEESKIVQRIIVLCVAKLYSFLITHKDPKKHANYFIKSSHSKKEYFLVDSALRAMSMPAEDLLFPQELNKKATKQIRRSILDLENESSTYFKSWEVTKALQDLENYDIFKNIRGKKEYKKAAPRPVRPKKGAGYENSRKKEGLYSAYKITENLATLNKLVTNPKALESIHRGLLEFGVLKEFYLFQGKAILHAIKIGGLSVIQFATVGAQATFDDPVVQTQLGRVKGLGTKQIEYSYGKMIQEHLVSLNEEELDKLAEDMVNLLIKNPIDHSHILLALSEL